MTMRWIWLVPSKICMTFTSSVYRHLQCAVEAPPGPDDSEVDVRLGA
jgi:hypothetical protein